MVAKIRKAKNIMDKLNKLDAQYLTGYPNNLPRSQYLAKRNALRKIFVALKK